MRREAVCGILVVLVTACAGRVESGDRGRVDAERAILEREAFRREVYTNLDTLGFLELTSPDYLAIGGEGVNRTQAIGLEAIREHLRTGPLIDSVVVDSVRLLVEGNVGVYTGRERFFRQDGLVGTNVFTNVWANRGGEWKLVRTQHAMLHQRPIATAEDSER